MKVVIPYKPRDVFRPLHARKERWAVVVAHRRAGKSVACINELIKCACMDSSGDGRYAYICPYYSQAKQVIWDYCKTFTKPNLGPQSMVQYGLGTVWVSSWDPNPT